MKFRLIILFLFSFFLFPLASDENNIDIQYFDANHYRRDSRLLALDESLARDFIFTEGIEIFCSDDTSLIYINDEKKRAAPAEYNDLPPGRYPIRIENKEYETEEFLVEIKQDMRCVINVTQTKARGTLKIIGLPENCEVFLNGNQLEGNLWPLLPGRYSVKINALDYQVFEKEINIYPSQRTDLEYKSVKIPFKISELAVSQLSFNPLDPPPLNSTRIRFSCSGKGWGVLTISDSLGNLILSEELTDLSQNNEEIEWNGLNEFGLALPAGEYTLKLSASDGIRDSEAETIILIDKRFSRKSRSLLTGISGAGLTPLPDMLPQGQLQMTTGWELGPFLSEENNSFSASATAGIRFNFLPRTEWCISAGLPFSTDDLLELVGVSLSVKYLLVPDFHGFSLAAASRAKLDLPFEAPLMISPEAINQQYSSLSLAPLGSYSAGPFRLVYSPGVSLLPVSQEGDYLQWSSTLHLWSVQKGGFFFEYGPVLTGVSAAYPLFFRENPYWQSEQPIQLAWDFTYQFPGQPFSINTIIMCEYYDTLTSIELLFNFSFLNSRS